MKILLCLLSILTLLPLDAIGQNPAIKFESGSWEDILAKAQSSGKMIFLDAYASWCGPCKVMERETFTNQEVGSYFNTNFINARIDMEKDKDGPFLSMTYDVKAYPSLYFIHPDGELVYKKEGLLYPADFLDLGSLVKNEGPRITEMRQQYESGERSTDFLTSYVNVIQELGLNEKEPVLEYFKSLADHDLLASENIKLISTYVSDYQSREFLTMLQNSEVSESVIGIKDYNEYLYMIFLERIINHLVEDDSVGLENTKKEALDVGIENLDEAILYGQAVYFLEIKDFKKALEFAQKLEKDPRILEIDLFNNIAWGIYENAESNDREVLLKAKELTRKSLLASDNSHNNDTYASILYNLGEIELAIEFMRRAVNLADEEGSAYFQEFKQKLETWQENN